MNVLKMLSIATTEAVFIVLGTFYTVPSEAAVFPQVEFQGDVTEIQNLNPQFQVAVGDTLSGSLTYNPDVVSKSCGALKFLSPLQADGALRNFPFGTHSR
ncbi:MAG: hypothetical protein JO235_07850 [Chroococcidiopsidaceae cyanobacterium CP_BM_RX_35]|nr:hypothetical protein [Chroococcidiopsidaceae cyanobacterium CP_BM_RX_35]